MRSFGGSFDLAAREEALAAVDEALRDPALWSDQKRAQETGRRRASLVAELDRGRTLGAALGDVAALRELQAEGENVAGELAAVLDRLEKAVADLELATMLSGENDAADAIVSLHPGAGGIDAQDWAAMLLRMYLRWAEARGYRTETVDLLPGEEAGIKSATVRVIGKDAFGFLKAERGVHRLVRISPFDAQARRHTAFAAVDVIPEVDEAIEVTVEDKDLRIDTYRSSGAGGQHVNVTDSAVRITHLPTGIVVQCQNERSQHRNRDVAMKILKARLLERARREQDEKRKAQEGEKKSVEWGSQIRSYVLAPYRLVKDHRTGVEIGDVDRVLDGDLDRLIREYLLGQAAARDAVS